MRIEVTFRGMVTDVIVDAYDVDEPTNSRTCEWHFDGMTPDDHNDLHVSDEEDTEILAAIDLAMHDQEVTQP